MLRQMKLRLSGMVVIQIFLCLLSAAMLFAAFPYLNQHYLAWFAFVPWFLAIERASRRRAFFLSYLTGVIFWGGTIYWLIHVTLIGLIGLVLYLSLYFAAFGVIISVAGSRFSLARVLFVPSVWVVLEFLRSYLSILGFPWALVAYTQSSRLPIIQASDITGVWGISFLILSVNVTLQGVVGALRDGKRPNAAATAFTAVLLAACVGYGMVKLRQPPVAGAHRYTIAVIQGNVPHEQKWKPEMRDAVMKTHLSLTREAAVAGADLVVWSEAALPVILENDPEYFEQVRSVIAQGTAPLLLGAITRRGRSFFNSALLLMPSGNIAGIYDKIHLVPFGEYIPLRAVFPFLETLAPIGEQTAGREYTVFRYRNASGAELNFSTQICFEDLFPGMTRKFVSRGADVLVNITNDAWYRFSPATYQHCQAAVFRAVENRVPVVRCANTGVSCFIDANGRIIRILEDDAGRQLFFSGRCAAPLSITRSGSTVYTRYGDYFIWICGFFVFAGALLYSAGKLRIL
jgi:apolipoprotein N-acyltransferase